MHTGVIIVVGNRFSEFQRNKGVMGVTAFSEALLESDFSQVTKVVLGQGLGDADIITIRQLLLEYAPHIPAPDELVRAERGLTHKHYASNVSVSHPVASGDGVYTAQLLLEEYNEILADHLTGQHIQGMALVEAARQMWTAVSELYVLEKQNVGRFVLDRISVEFLGYVFPLPVEVRMSLIQTGSEESGLEMMYLVDFIQHDKVCASVEGGVRIVPKKVAEFQEVMAARQAVTVARRAAPAPVTPVAVNEPELIAA